MSQDKIDFATVKFMIIDNSPLAADLVKDVLAMLGTREIHKMLSTERAIDALRKEAFDIVITELETEPMGGFEFARFIRTSEYSPNRFLPIIMMTARSEEKYVAEARDCGITEFVAKPFTIQTLYKRLVSAIAKPRQFVQLSDFFGPDRRRSRQPYSGAERRVP